MNLEQVDIHATEIISLGGNDGLVYIETVGHQNMNMTICARELYRDLPALYYMCKKAIKEDDERTKEKFKEFEKQLKEDFKKPVGRPKGDN